MAANGASPGQGAQPTSVLSLTGQGGLAERVKSNSVAKDAGCSPVQSLRFPMVHLQSSEKFFHTLESTIQFSNRRGVRNPDVLVGTEAFPGHRRHVRLAEQSCGQIRC